MSRDPDRRRVYAAENLVFDQTLHTEPLGPAGVMDLAELVAAEPWWAAHGVRFELIPARRESGHSSATHRAAGVSRIRLSIHQEDAATLAHELAHLLSAHHGARVGHGARFRTAELDVVAMLCGTVASARLAEAFAQHGLGLAPRGWPAPDRLTERGLYGQWRVARLGGLQR